MLDILCATLGLEHVSGPHRLLALPPTGSDPIRN